MKKAVKLWSFHSSKSRGESGMTLEFLNLYNSVKNSSSDLVTM